jgi:hypothetical protein
MRQNRDAIERNLAERWCWQVACWGDLGLAWCLYRQ